MAHHLDPQHHATTEGREFLEALILLRGLYAARGPRDRATVASIEPIAPDTRRPRRAPRFEVSV